MKQGLRSPLSGLVNPFGRTQGGGPSGPLFTLETFTGTPVAEGSGVFLLQITSPGYLADYDAGEVEGAGHYRYDTDDLATGPIVLYPGTVNAASYADGDFITPGNLPFGVGSQVPDIFYRVYSDTPSPNTEVFDGATLNFDTTGRGDEELRVVSYMTDENGESAEATIGTFTIAPAPAGITDPTELGAKLLFWFDPTDLTKQWQNTAKTTAVTATGQTVLRISDKAGAGGDFGADSLGPELTIAGSDYYWTFADGEEFRKYTALAQTTTDEIAMNINITADGGAQAIVAGSGGTQFAAVIQSGAGTSPHGGVSPSYRVNGTPVTSATRGTLYTAVNPGNWVTLSISSLDMATSSEWDSMRIFRYPSAPTTSAFGLLGDVVITTALTTEEREGLEIWLESRRPA